MESTTTKAAKAAVPAGETAAPAAAAVTANNKKEMAFCHLLFPAVFRLLSQISFLDEGKAIFYHGSSTVF